MPSYEKVIQSLTFNISSQNAPLFLLKVFQLLNKHIYLSITEARDCVEYTTLLPKHHCTT